MLSQPTEILSVCSVSVQVCMHAHSLSRNKIVSSSIGSVAWWDFERGASSWGLRLALLHAWRTGGHVTPTHVKSVKAMSVFNEYDPLLHRCRGKRGCPSPFARTGVLPRWPSRSNNCTTGHSWHAHRGQGRGLVGGVWPMRGKCPSVLMTLTGAETEHWPSNQQTLPPDDPPWPSGTIWCPLWAWRTPTYSSSTKPWCTRTGRCGWTRCVASEARRGTWYPGYMLTCALVCDHIACIPNIDDLPQTEILVHACSAMSNQSGVWNR